MSRARTGLVTTLLLALVLASGLGVISLARRSLQKLPELGKLPSVAVEAGAEQRLLDSFGGRILVIGLLTHHRWQDDCEPCRALEDHLDELALAVGDEASVRVLSLTAEGPPPPPETPYVSLTAAPEALTTLDGLRHVAGAPELDAERFPALLLLVDSNGQLRGRYDGSHPASVKVLKTHLRQLYRSEQRH